MDVTSSTFVFFVDTAALSIVLNEIIIGDADRVFSQVACYFFTWLSWYVINNNEFMSETLVACLSKRKPRSIPKDDLDTLFTCLSISRQRRLIQILAEETTLIGFETVAQQIRKREGRLFDGDEGTSRQEVSISLVHNYLPKMADTAIVSIDFEMDTVEEGPRFTVALSHLELV